MRFAHSRPALVVGLALLTSGLVPVAHADTPLDTWEASFDAPASIDLPETGTVMIEGGVSTDAVTVVTDLAKATAKRCAYSFTPHSKITRSGGDTITQSSYMTAKYNCGSFAANVTIRDELPQGLDPKTVTKTLTGASLATIRPATSQTVSYFTLGVPTRPTTTLHLIYRLGRSASNFTFCFDHSYTITLGAPPTDDGVKPMTHADCNA